MSKSILKSVEKNIKISLKDKHTPKTFFKDREGLYVWDSFTDNILPKAKLTKADTKFSISSFDLVKSATDEEIENTLLKGHIFSETDVCAIIAGLIEKQPKGEKGTLLSNGYINLFYTPSRIVLVSWGGSRWGVGTWGRGDGAWDSGYRVFSPASES